MNNLDMIIEMVIGIATSIGVLISLWIGVIQPKIKRLRIEFMPNYTEHICVLSNLGDVPICLREIELFYIESRWKYIISKKIIRYKFFKKIIFEIYNVIFKEQYKNPYRLRGVCALSELYYMPVPEEACKIENFMVLEPHTVKIVSINIEKIRRNIGHKFEPSMLLKGKKMRLIVTDVDYKMFIFCTEYDSKKFVEEFLEIQKRKFQKLA